MRNILITLPLLLSFACGGGGSPAAKSDKKDDKAEAAKVDAPKADGPKTHDITKLGLKIDGPGDATIEDMMGSQMIRGAGLVVTVKPAGDFFPKTLEDAKKEATDMYTGTEMAEETLADGWALTFVNEGGMGKNYWVQVARTIDGQTYACETTASQADQQANALAACKSLKK